MSKVISYSSEENLMRIKMQKKQIFIVVEGEDDVPIYEIAIHSIVMDKKIDVGFEVIHAGGKENIKAFASVCKQNNFRAILDLDFDHKDQVDDDRLNYLNVYSIENHFFGKVVTSYLLSSILKKRYSDVKEWLNIDGWYDEINAQCVLLLKYLFYYQKAFGGERKKWSDAFIVRDNKCWKIDPNKVTFLLDRIKREIGVEDDAVENFFAENFTTGDCISKVFPGKILFVSFYRYLKIYVESGYKGVFGANYTNDTALKNSSCSLLKFNPDFRKTISPIIQFLESQAA